MNIQENVTSKAYRTLEASSSRSFFNIDYTIISDVIKILSSLTFKDTNLDYSNMVMIAIIYKSTNKKRKKLRLLI